MSLRKPGSRLKDAVGGFRLNAVNRHDKSTGGYRLQGDLQVRAKRSFQSADCSAPNESGWPGHGLRQFADANRRNLRHREIGQALDRLP